MKTAAAARLFEALASDARLDVFRLLVKHAPDGLVAGDIARRLKIPATNLSFHLKALVHSGLVTVEKEGRYLRYRAVIPLMLDLVAFLTAECCAGQPERCRDYRKSSRVPDGVLPDNPQPTPPHARPVKRKSP